MTKTFINILAGPMRVLLLAAFLLLAKMGWFTWLTPENHHEYVNLIMDFLVLAVPALYALWVGIQAWRNNQPEAIVKAAADLPQVHEIVTTQALADAVHDNPTVRAG